MGDSMLFMKTAQSKVGDIPVRITRCGYTGEDGFEVSVANTQAVELAETLLKNDTVQLAGLGARDTLRLECGFALYGNDIDETTSPIEAGLQFAMSKKRREQGGFLGYERIKKELAEGPPRKRVGVAFKDQRGAARQHAKLIDPRSGTTVGEVTSGSTSPTLKYPIAMAYVNTDFAKAGTLLEVANRPLKGEVVALPFVQTNYYRGKGK
eukprot:NODE_1667_length_1338_cov_8.351435_g1382_i0.p1 GENE.NODE_1667_length_1338_cov_8.351435_g1382_i0~~NODE_1667_length_1338_cov_8.351435_g1382_i0.p1  ORF type:complete len:209 (-),score=64.83 NODE_1667_length_1338_cov_8.351435_g1382_i0:710-1336(-)